MRLRTLKIGMMVAGGALVVTFLAAAVLLYYRIAQFSKAEQDFRALWAQLRQLYQRDPFPTEENVARERENRAMLQGEFDRFLGRLTEKQIDPEKKTPPMFMALFWETRKKLLDQARVWGVAVPENFGFGFGGYLGGYLPAPEDVSRLTQQLGMIAELCGILYEARITELEDIRREIFDSASMQSVPAAPSGRSGRRWSSEAPAEANAETVKDAGLMGPEDTFAKFHFSVALKGTEAAILETLNRMARSPMFIVVTGLEIVSEESGVMHVSRVVAEEDVLKSAKPPTDAGRNLQSKDDRIVSGRDKPMSAVIEADVYWFRKPAEAEQK
jgi:hypothetical protein